MPFASAGTNAALGRPMHPASARALADLGGDPRGFRPRQLTAGMAADADLVLTMTRRHRSVVLGLNPRSLRRTFTLSEAAGLTAHGDHDEVRSSALRDRARLLSTQLDGARALRPGSRNDDILDPIDSPARVHRRVARRIAMELQVLIEILLPPPGQGHADRPPMAPQVIIR